MDSYSDENWFYDQHSLDPFDETNDYTNLYPALPPIPEAEDWDFNLGWVQESNAQSDAQLLSETLAADDVPSEQPSPAVVTELSNILEQCRELRKEVLDLHGVVCKRLDSMEKSVTVTQRYVNNLVPWSMQVHENYVKLVDWMSETDKGRTSGANKG